MILPTYEEFENLEAVVGGFGAAVPEARILVVDDNSRDGTAELADALAAADAAVEVLHRPGKAGLGRAYAAGFARVLAAGADYVVEMDADLSHDPADLPRLIAPAREGADLVLGSRYVSGGGIENWGLERRLLSTLLRGLRDRAAAGHLRAGALALAAFAVPLTAGAWRQSPNRTPRTARFSR